jgi:hypothetical protein
LNNNVTLNLISSVIVVFIKVFVFTNLVGIIIKIDTKLKILIHFSRSKITMTVLIKLALPSYLNCNFGDHFLKQIKSSKIEAEESLLDLLQSTYLQLGMATGRIRSKLD